MMRPSDDRRATVAGKGPSARLARRRPQGFFDTLNEGRVQSGGARVRAPRSHPAPRSRLTGRLHGSPSPKALICRPCRRASGALRGAPALHSCLIARTRALRASRVRKARAAPALPRPFLCVRDCATAAAATLQRASRAGGCRRRCGPHARAGWVGPLHTPEEAPPRERRAAHNHRPRQGRCGRWLLAAQERLPACEWARCWGGTFAALAREWQPGEGVAAGRGRRRGARTSGEAGSKGQRAPSDAHAHGCLRSPLPFPAPQHTHTSNGGTRGATGALGRLPAAHASARWLAPASPRPASSKGRTRAALARLRGPRGAMCVCTHPGTAWRSGGRLVEGVGRMGAACSRAQNARGAQTCPSPRAPHSSQASFPTYPRRALADCGAF